MPPSSQARGQSSILTSFISNRKLSKTDFKSIKIPPGHWQMCKLTRMLNCSFCELPQPIPTILLSLYLLVSGYIASVPYEARPSFILAIFFLGLQACHHGKTVVCARFTHMRVCVHVCVHAPVRSEVKASTFLNHSSLYILRQTWPRGPISASLFRDYR